MNNVIIYGSGSLAREIVNFEASLSNPRVNFVGYINDSGPDESFEQETGISRVFLSESCSGYSYLICVADPVARLNILKKIDEVDGQVYTYIHPTVILSKTAVVSVGCIIYPYVVISVNSYLGRCVIINTYSGIGHDVSVGDCTTISAHVDLMGYVQVGECCFFGSGSRVAPGKKIGSSAKIGTGISVIRSVKEKSTIFPYANKVL
jgi:sugar O-acyltransferase (sialic acid O-acetyltransferase NeuD family)